MTQHTIRHAAIDDLGRIKEIAVASGVYNADEAELLDGMLKRALDGSLEGYEWLVVENGIGVVSGISLIGPEPFADRMWRIHLTAVDPAAQRTGIARAIMSHIEADLRQRGQEVARTLVIDTASTAEYASARKSCASLGFDEEARIRDFYGPGAHKVIFWKALS